MDDPSTGKHTTDFYLASLAQKHGMQLATLDEGIKHQAAFVIPAWNTFPASRLPDSRRPPRSMTWQMAPGYSIRIVRGMPATSRANNERNQPPV